MIEWAKTLKSRGIFLVFLSFPHISWLEVVVASLSLVLQKIGTVDLSHK